MPAPQDMRPWVPEEAAPRAGWPALPDDVPVVVSGWRQLDDGAARPSVRSRATRGVALKRDRGAQRARQFAEAWRWLRDAGGVSRDDLDLPRLQWLYDAGVLAPVRER